MASGGAKSKTVVKAVKSKEKTAAVMSGAANARLGEEKAAEICDLLEKFKVQEWGGQEGAAKFDEDMVRSREESKMIRMEQGKEAGRILNKC